MRNIAIIPARGGSKRIPRKNIKDFLGKPIIAYSIEVAIESGLFDEVMVSTDDEEIAKIAKQYGATVPFMRSKKAADDYAGLDAVLLEVLYDYKKRFNKTFQYLACILPTAPLIQTDTLKKAFQHLTENKYMAVTPVVPFSYPILRSLKFDSNNRLIMNWPEYYKSRSQDLPQAFHDAGMFYFLDYNYFIKDKKLFPKEGTGIALNETEVQDIDNETDWKLAELKYKLLNG